MSTEVLDVVNVQSDGDTLKDADKFRGFVAEGRKALITGDKDSAIDKLSDACELGAKLYGEKGDELFDAYILYGRAQCDFAAHILANVVKQDVADEADSSDEEGDEEDGEVKEGDGEQKESGVEGEATPQFEKEEDKEDVAGQGETGLTQDLGDTTIDPNNENIDDPKDEFTDMVKSAWEVMELARNIAEGAVVKNAGQEAEKEWKRKVGDAQYYIGQLLIVDEEYDKALEELTNSFGTKSEVVPEYSRELADIHYQIGRTHFLKDDYKLAVESYNKVVEIMIKLTAHLISTKTEDNSEEVEKEVTEVAEILKDIKGEIDIANEQEVLEGRIKEELKARILGSVPMEQKPDNNEPVNDITELVRKRRKPVEETSETDAKKPRDD